MLPQLLIKPGFVDQHDCNALIHFLEGLPGWGNASHGDFNERKHHNRLVNDVLSEPSATQNIKDIVRTFQSKKKAAIEDFFGETLVQTSRASFRKWVPGDFQSPHCDIGHANGEVIFTNNDDTLSLHHYDFATVTYLNHNFEGGQIYFHYQGVEIIPTQGLMIAFPASPQYLHGVREITSGNRYIITSFWPRARTIVHNLIPSLGARWWNDVENIDEVMSMIPEQEKHRINPALVPPKHDR